MKQIIIYKFILSGYLRCFNNFNDHKIILKEKWHKF